MKVTKTMFVIERIEIVWTWKKLMIYENMFTNLYDLNEDAGKLNWLL